MGVFLLVMLLFPGVCDLSSSVPRQFHVVKTDKTWADAQQHCREKFTDLATIHNMADIEKIKTLLQDEDYEVGWKLWTGLRQGRWQWSLADEGFYGENETEFRKWAAKMPRSGSSKDRDGADCASIHNNGQWYNNPCKDEWPFLCYEERKATAYVLVEEWKNWTDAQKHCREKHTDLASVRNQADHDKLIEAQGGHQYVWIGLFREAWEWSDSSSSSFRHWAPGEPDYGVLSQHGLCGELNDPGQWNDEDCNEGRHSVCYEDPPDLPMATVVVVSPHPPFYSGDEVTLRCDIPEYADWHQYVWLNDNSTVPGKTNHTITITLPLEAGQYQCKGERHDHPTTSSVSSSVDIISNALPNATVMVSPPPPFHSGDEVTLRCDILEYTDWYQYVWLKDSTPLPGKTSRTIAITLPLEAGQYQCKGQRNNHPLTSSVSSSVDIISNALVKRSQMVRVEMEAFDGVDMEHPDVQKVVLQQIRDRLKDKGFPGDVKLSWTKQADGKVFHKKNDKKKERRTEL